MSRENNIARQECYNCHRYGHLSINCVQPQRAARCQECNRVGAHRSNCPSAVSQVLAVVQQPTAPESQGNESPRPVCRGCGETGHTFIRCPTTIALVHLADRRSIFETAIELYGEWQITTVEFSPGCSIRSAGNWAMAPFEIWHCNYRLFYSTSFRQGRMTMTFRHNRDSARIIMTLRQQDDATIAKIIISLAAVTVNRRLVISSSATVNWSSNRTHIGNGAPNLRIAGPRCPRLDIRRFGRRVQLELSARGVVATYTEHRF